MKMKMLAAKLAALVALVIAIGGTWSAASAAPAALTIPTAASPSLDGEPHAAKKSSRKELTGKVNLNTATEEQLMLLPAVGPAKAERIVAWRKKNGGFKRIADLRHVKGFGYKSFKKLEPFLDLKGDTTLEAK
jgi:competence protein ComEA